MYSLKYPVMLHLLPMSNSSSDSESDAAGQIMRSRIICCQRRKMEHIDFQVQYYCLNVAVKVH